MVALETPSLNQGWIAPDFKLPATDGKEYTLNDLKGAKGTVIIFMCNHCPYVQKVLHRIMALTHDLKGIGVELIAISSNDAKNYPEDSFEAMQELAEREHFPFTYLYDETQAVATAYGAVCTPDIYGFNHDMELQYRGRIDDDVSGTLEHPKRELFDAMQEIAATGHTTKPQHSSIGCSIKWRPDTKSARA